DTVNTPALLKYKWDFLDSLPKPQGLINDYESLYTMDEERKLDSIIKRFKRTTGIEIVIITFDSNCVSKENFNSLTLRIANTWHIGQKGKDNGILIGISKGHQIMRIENGYGIEKLITDKETKEIIYTAFIPYFKKNSYYDGTFNGVLKLMDLLNTKLN
ncbi:MAG TPA: TPM domain-containing protein, partial [Cytophaga sp.]|nr:TPM domain-containing protein [Cytophaga sp.]